MWALFLEFVSSSPADVTQSVCAKRAHSATALAGLACSCYERRNRLSRRATLARGYATDVLKVEKLAIEGMPLLSFEVAAGECLAIEGPSGSGKTRILRAVADLDPSGGYVFFEGAERAEVPAYEWRRQVRYISTEPGWWTDTARQHVVRQPESQRFVRLATSLGIAADTLDRPIAQLSTGERLRLGLARSLADEPRVILLDEPTGALDPIAAALVEELIRFQVLAGRSVVLVSHDANQVRRLVQKQLQLGASHSTAALPAPPRAGAPATDPRLANLAERWDRQP